MQDEILYQVLEGCRKFDRMSQQRLYSAYYNYAMSISRRYTGGQQKAEEVVNDAFLKFFTSIERFDNQQAFRPWLRRIIINTAIDLFRSEIKHDSTLELQPWHETGVDSDIELNLTQDQIFKLLDQLPPAYRTVFNMNVVDGQTHEEISQALGISIGASKSNLSRARGHLKRILQHEKIF